MTKPPLGKKDAIGDINKPRMSLIPKEALWEMGKALSVGEVQKGTHNFKQGIPISYLLDANIRHVYQFINGEDIDDGTKVHHLGCAMANLAMALYMYYNRQDLDDRFSKPERNIKGVNITFDNGHIVIAEVSDESKS